MKDDQVIIKKCCGAKRTSPLEKDASILDDFNLSYFVPNIIGVETNYRPEEKVLVIDIYFDNGEIFYIKMPEDTKIEYIDGYLKPLIDLLEKYKRSKVN
jgi:hypothetical protein